MRLRAAAVVPPIIPVAGVFQVHRFRLSAWGTSGKVGRGALVIGFGVQGGSPPPG